MEKTVNVMHDELVDLLNEHAKGLSVRQMDQFVQVGAHVLFQAFTEVLKSDGLPPERAVDVLGVMIGKTLERVYSIEVKTLLKQINKETEH